MTALEFLKLMDTKTYNFILSDNPLLTPQFYTDVYNIVLDRWPWAKNRLI